MELKLAMAASAIALVVGDTTGSQITFQSAEVLGIAAADTGTVGVGPTRHTDRTVRFWSDDGRTYHLDAFGCRFEMRAWPQALDEAPGPIAQVLTTDIDAYRRAASGAVSDVGEITPFFKGMLYRASSGPAGKDTYGLDCSEKAATAVALDVLKTPSYRQLRIFIVQADLADMEAGREPHKAMAVSFMQNMLFRRGDTDTLAARAPFTADLYDALTR